MLSRRAFLASQAAAAAPRVGRLFSFAALADTQYADQPTAGARDYRASLPKLRQCARYFENQGCAFTIHLGDLVDSGLDNLERVLPHLDALPQPVFHVIGNHDTPRDGWLKRLNMPAAHYKFSRDEWDFIVLDGLAIRAGDGGQGDQILDELKRRNEPNAQAWNGGLGASQREWLADLLADSARRGRLAGLFCHYPIMEGSARPDHFLWDWRQTRAIVQRAGNVRFWMNGHDHRGIRVRVLNTDYFTLKGLVENPPEACAAIVDIFADGVSYRTASMGLPKV
jgi:3',5'-cyclic AMP phosphodiesterase CpdA